MDLIELREKQASFENRLWQVKEERAILFKLLRKFWAKFPISKVKSLEIDDYVLGRYLIDNTESFCYWLEKKLDDLGKISGSPAWQYGVYFGTYKGDKSKKYRHMQRWGDNLEDSFIEVKKAIVNLLDSGKKKDFDSIANNIIADKLKGKILSTYYPDTYLNIFSAEYLNDILLHLNLDDKEILEDYAIYKQERLIKFKNDDIVMRNWSLDEFSVFINDEMLRNFYNADGLNKELTDFVNPKFPPLNTIVIEEVSFDINEASEGSDISATIPAKVERKSQILKKLGTRGELIVLEYERNRLIKNKRPDLAKKIIHVAKTDDTAGYDILSYEIDGKPKYVEVKATKLPPGKAQFYISLNEKNKSEKLQNYNVYIVHGVTTKNPKIWNIGNPFNPFNDRIKIKPITFSVNIN